MTWHSRSSGRYDGKSVLHVQRLTIVLWSTDIAALSTFLERVAGGRVEARHPGFAVVLVGESRVEVHADEGYTGHPWFNALRREGAARGIGAEIRVAVDDVDGAWSEALRGGAVGIQAPTDAGDTYECVVMGPDGYLFSLWRPATT